MNLPEERELTGWMIAGEQSFVKEKCDCCDNNRHIAFYSPSGQRYSEYCSCASQRYYRLYPKEIELAKFKVHKCTGEITKYYRKVGLDEYTDYDVFELTHEFKPEEHDEMDFDSYYVAEKMFDTFFSTKEDAQKVCNYVNEKAIQKAIENEKRYNLTR